MGNVTPEGRIPNHCPQYGPQQPSLVPRPTSQMRMDYITATRIVGLVSSCTNFCPVAPECWSDQSDLRYAYSSYQSKLSDISYGGKARDG